MTKCCFVILKAAVLAAGAEVILKAAALAVGLKDLATDQTLRFAQGDEA